MKIIDENYVNIKADSCESIDIQLENESESLNVILPSKHILVIEPNGTVTVFDSTDTQLSTINLIK